MAEAAAEAHGGGEGWKPQKPLKTASGSAGTGQGEKKKPCKVCKGFGQAWDQFEKKEAKPAPDKTAAASGVPKGYKDCPEDLFSLGRKTWAFLHTMAETYPPQPSQQDQRDMSQFMSLFAKFYPCGECGDHLKQHIKKEPPEVSSQHGLAQWMCRMHNDVNRRLGKPEFDCSKVSQRWSEGWDDGSCD